MGYREPIEVLEARRRELQDEAWRLRSDRAKLARAHQEEEAAEKKLHVIEAELRKVSLPIDSVQASAPCDARWKEMRGDERVRECGRCKKKVYDLSKMTREQAENLVRFHEGAPPSVYFRRTDGTVVTSDCPDGVRKRMLALALVGAGVIVALVLGFSALVTAHTVKTNAWPPTGTTE